MRLKGGNASGTIFHGSILREGYRDNLWHCGTYMGSDETGIRYIAFEAESKDDVIAALKTLGGTSYFDGMSGNVIAID